MKKIRTIAILSVLLVSAGHAGSGALLQPDTKSEAHQRAHAAVSGAAAAPVAELKAETSPTSISRPVVEKIQSYASQAWTSGWSYLKSAMSTGAQYLREKFPAKDAQDPLAPVSSVQDAEASAKADLPSQELATAETQEVLPHQTSGEAEASYLASGVNAVRYAGSVAWNVGSVAFRITKPVASFAWDVYKPPFAPTLDTLLGVGGHVAAPADTQGPKVFNTYAERGQALGHAVGNWKTAVDTGKYFVEPLVGMAAQTTVAPVALKALPVLKGLPYVGYFFAPMAASVYYLPAGWAIGRLTLNILQSETTQKIYRYTTEKACGATGWLVGKSLDLACAAWKGSVDVQAQSEISALGQSDAIIDGRTGFEVLSVFPLDEAGSTAVAAAA